MTKPAPLLPAHDVPRAIQTTCQRARVRTSRKSGVPREDLEPVRATAVVVVGAVCSLREGALHWLRNGWAQVDDVGQGCAYKVASRFAGEDCSLRRVKPGPHCHRDSPISASSTFRSTEQSTRRKPANPSSTLELAGGLHSWWLAYGRYREIGRCAVRWRRMCPTCWPATTKRRRGQRAARQLAVTRHPWSGVPLASRLPLLVGAVKAAAVVVVRRCVTGDHLFVISATCPLLSCSDVSDCHSPFPLCVYSTLF